MSSRRVLDYVLHLIRSFPSVSDFSRLPKTLTVCGLAILFVCIAETSYGQNNLRILTSELPTATVGTEYSAILTATGGAPPYRWTVVTGSSVPSGLQLSTSGVISGTPSLGGTFTFAVEVADTRGNNQPRDSRTIRLTIAPQGVPTPPQPEPTTPSSPEPLPPQPEPTTPSSPEPLPPQPEPTTPSSPEPLPPQPEPTTPSQFPSLSLVGVPAMMSAAQSFEVQLSLSAPFPVGISGTLKLAFAPTIAIPVDDPFVQFSTGTRTVDFSIPANSTAAVFTGPVFVMTGTTAGVIRLAADIHSGPSDVLLASTIVRTGPPQITKLAAHRNNGVLQVQVSGYSPDRWVTSIQFAFDIRLLGTVQQIMLERNVENEFMEWYQTAESSRFGTSFFFEQSFLVEGDERLIEAVAITFANNQGRGTAVGVRFPEN